MRILQFKKRFLSSTVFFGLLVILLIASVGASLTGWTRNYGGTDSDYATALVETSDGGYAIAGYTGPFGAGIDDFWLIKTDSLGNLEWTQTYGGTSIDRANSLVQTSDGGYAIAGETLSFGAGMGDFWLIKTDANGNEQWNKLYGGTDRDSQQSLVHTSDGGYAIGGYTYSFSAGGADFWLVKTDANGNVQWNQTYGGPELDAADSLIQTNDGGYAIAGVTHSFGAGGKDFWLVKTDGAGNMEWNQTYGGIEGEGIFTSLVQTSDGGYALAGETESFGAGNQDFWLVKTDPVGNLQWNKTYGGMFSDTARSLVQTSDGGYALAGETNSFGLGNGDAWLVKTDASGNMEWNQTHGGTRSESVESLVETSDGGYALAGETRSFSAGHIDAWLVKTDGHGKIPEFLVHIKADGTVEGTDKIQQNGNIYTFTDNIFVDEFSVERDNIIVDGNGYTLSGSGVYGGGIGFNLNNINNVTIQNTNIQNFTFGIHLQASFFTTISGNNINNNRVGISLTYSYDNIISGNKITTNNLIGIYFFGGSHNLISGNNITANRDGLQMYGSLNTISGNTITNNSYSGFIIRHSSEYNHIKGNTITNNSNGIHLTRSTYNSIFENNITDNNNGMYFYKESSNNTIYSNNFVNNDIQIFIDPKHAENLSVNVWDNGVEGNYWSNYTGIGDTPHIIDENNQDNYPLVKQYIIPEFPSWIPLLFTLLALTVTLITYRYNLHVKPKNQQKHVKPETRA